MSSTVMKDAKVEEEYSGMPFLTACEMYLGRETRLDFCTSVRIACFSEYPVIRVSVFGE